MENKTISLDGWELVDAGHTTVSTIAINSLQMNGRNGHDGYLRKAVMVPKATNILLSAISYRSHPKASDVQVGISAQWGHWAGRDFTTSTPTYLLNEHGGGLLILMLRFAGEWGTHTCQFRDIQLSYEPVSDPEPEPPPDSGIAGQLAEIHQEIRGITEQIKLHLDQLEVRVREIDKLMAEDKKAHDWVDTYNRSIK